MNTSLRDELITLTTELIRFPSTADRHDQLLAAMNYTTDYLNAIPNLYIHHSAAEGKPAIVVTLHETRTPAIFINVHLDVIPARPEQFQPEVSEDRIYGRASQDMKGSVAVALRLIQALAAQEHRPNVGFQFVSDEEIGGEQGTRRLLAEGWRCDFFLALEPTNMQICYEQKGILWMELRIPGKSAHASSPWEGHNPLFELSAGLEELKQRSPPPESRIWTTTITPTAWQSGDNARNQVPQEIVLTLDIRHTLEDTVDALHALVHTCFPTAEITIREMGAPFSTDLTTPLLCRLADVNSHIRGQRTEFYREHFGSDARFYSSVGIPAICFGPVGAGLHSDNEWVDIDSLVELYRVLLAYVQGIE